MIGQTIAHYKIGAGSMGIAYMDCGVRAWQAPLTCEPERPVRGKPRKLDLRHAPYVCSCVGHTGDGG